MNEINHYFKLNLDFITKEEHEESNDIAIDQVIYKERLLNSYKNWIAKLKETMLRSNYRKVLGMIEKIPTEFIEFQNKCEMEFYRLRCILKIIQHKTIKYKFEYKQGNRKEMKRVEFWINQLYFTLNHLILEIRPDINNNSLNCSREEALNQIEYAVIYTLECIYQLIQFSLQIDEIPEICCYFAMTDRLEMVIAYCRNPKTLQTFQKISLVKIKLVITNLDYDYALVCIEKTLSFCFRQLFLLIDFDEGFSHLDKNSKKKDEDMIYTCFVHMVISFYYRGVCYEAIGNICKGVKSYRQCDWICKKFLKTTHLLITEFFDGLLRRGISYLRSINDIIEDNDKITKKKNKINKEIILAKEKESEEKKMKKMILERIANGEQTGRVRKLDKTLKIINNINIKDITLPRKSQYPRSQYITSTVNLIDYLLSKSFRPIVSEMKTLALHCLDNDTNRKISKEISKIHKKEESFTTSKNQEKKILRKRIFYPKMNRLNKSETKNQSRNVNASSPSLRYLPNSVERIRVNNNYDKNYSDKRDFLEKYNLKELQFHKKLLKSKINEFNEKPTMVNEQFIRNNVEKFFKQNLHMTKESKIKINFFDSQKDFKSLNLRNKLENQMLKSLSTKTLLEYKKNIKSFISWNPSKTRCFSSDNTFNLDYATINKENNDIIEKLGLENNQIECLKNKSNKPKVKYNIKLGHG